MFKFTKMVGDDEAQPENRWHCNAKCVFPKRYMVAVFIFLGFANLYAMRVNLSVAVAVMVANHTVIGDGKEVQEPPEFSWSTKQQGIILSAFYYGYILTQLPGGILARKVGGATLLGISIGASGLMTLLTPTTARAHVGILIALRIAIGMAEGFVYPAGLAVWSQWAPPLERSRLTTFNPAGSRFGILVSMFLSGYIAFNFGWPAIFYVFGISGIAWSAVWFLLVSNSPANQRWISAEELDYIESSLASNTKSKEVAIPWKAIFTSLPVWAIIIAQFTDMWGHYTMISDLPLYFSQQLHFDIKATSVASALPYICYVVTMLFGGQLADYLRKHHLSTGTVRKLFTTLGFLPMMVFPIAAGYVDSDCSLAVLFMTLGVGLNGMVGSGYFVNQLDIASPFASVLMGIINIAGTMSGIISPTMTGFITQNHSTEEWRTVFYINGVVFLIGLIIYLLFSSGETQSWATDNEYEKLTTVESSADKNQ